MILSSFASRADHAMDMIGIEKEYEMLKKEAELSSAYHPHIDEINATAEIMEEEGKAGIYDPKSIHEWIRFSRKALEQHKLLSIWHRHPSDDTASVDRVWIVFGTFLCTSAIGVLFVASPNDTRSEDLIKILTTVYCTLSSLLFGVVLKQLFGLKFDRRRFQKLFITVCEQKMIEHGLDLKERDPLLKPWRLVEILMLKDKYKCGMLDIMAVKSMTVDTHIRNIDFRRSKYDLLAREGFQLVHSFVTVDDFKESWLNSSYMKYVLPKKRFGYVWLSLWTIGAIIVVLSNMLTLAIEGDGNQLFIFGKGFGWSLFMDLCVMQWVTFGWQDMLLCCCLKRKKLPKNFPARNRYSYKCALAEYDRNLRGIELMVDRTSSRERNESTAVKRTQSTAVKGTQSTANVSLAESWADLI